MGRVKYKVSDETKKNHSVMCHICNHAKRRDIELDYIHCIPWSTIRERYDINDKIIERHARVYELSKLRDRKSFYWRVVENANFKKATLENALDAAKWLDRLEHKVERDITPTNIQVIYSSGLLAESQVKQGKDNDALSDRVRAAITDTDRVRAVTDTEEVPSEPDKV